MQLKEPLERIPAARFWIGGLLASLAVLASLVLLRISRPVPLAWAQSVLGDGRFVVTEATGPDEVAEDAGIAAQFPSADELGLPWFPASNTTLTCVKDAVDGVAVALASGQALPCGTSPSDIGRDNGVSDRVVAEGYIVIPDGATSIVLRATNEQGSTPRAGAVYFYASKSDDRSNLELLGGGGSTRLMVIDMDLPIPQGECARPPALAYRVYVHDAYFHGGANLKWQVDGGQAATAGFTAIQRDYLMSLEGYDNDANDNGIADYRELDTDQDGVADWEEMGRELSGGDRDSDGDGLPDCSDTDSDNDGLADGDDPNRIEATAVSDSGAVVQGAQLTLDVAANDIEFAGDNNTVTDEGTGSASGYSLSPAGLLSWNPTVDPGEYTIDYRICNDSATPPGCAQAVATITVLAAPDLKISVTPPTETIPGESAILEIEVQNLSQAPAEEAIVEVILPDQVAVSDDFSTAECTRVDHKTVRCSLGTLVGDARTSLKIAIRVASDAASQTTLVGGIATATTSSVEMVDVNNSMHFGIETAAAVAALDVDVDVAGLVIPGNVTSVDVVVENQGPSSAEQYRLTLVVPDDSTVAVALLPSSCDEVKATELMCLLPSLGVGDSFAMTLLLDVRADATTGEVLAGGRVWTTAGSQDRANPDTSSEFSFVVGSISAELSISAKASADPASRSHRVLIEVHNAGPSTARGAVLVVDTPDGYTTAESSLAPECTVVGASVNCRVDDLDSGARYSTSISMAGPDSSGQDPVRPSPSTASVASSTHDDRLANNSTSYTLAHT